MNYQIETLTNETSRIIFKFDDKLVRTLSPQSRTLYIKIKNDTNVVNLIDSNIEKFWIYVNGAQYIYNKDNKLYGEISLSDLQQTDDNKFMFDFDVINKDNNDFIVLWREIHDENFLLQIRPDQCDVNNRCIDTVTIGFSSYPKQNIDVKTFIFSIS